MVLTEWRLQLNADKSEVVILGTSHQLRDAANIQMIDMASSRLAVSDRDKSLGVTIDSHLPFDCMPRLQRSASV